jgi:hypothetical protein
MLVKYVNFQLALDNHYANKLPLLIVWLSILNPSSTSLRNIWPVKWNSLQIYLCLARIPFHLLVRWEQALARLADTLQCEQRHPGLILAPTSAWEWGTAPRFKKKSLSGDATASILHQAIWSSNKSTLGLIPHKWYDPLHSLAWPQPCMLFIICPGPLSVSSTLSSSVTPATQSFKPKPRLLIFST